MDRKPNLFKNVIWNINVGDLVKIRKHDYSGNIYYHHGIVIGEREECQLELFPYVTVYIFESASTTKQYPNALEIISSLHA